MSSMRRERVNLRHVMNMLGDDGLEEEADAAAADDGPSDHPASGQQQQQQQDDGGAPTPSGLAVGGWVVALQ